MGIMAGELDLGGLGRRAAPFERRLQGAGLAGGRRPARSVHPQL